MNRVSCARFPGRPAAVAFVLFLALIGSVAAQQPTFRSGTQVVSVFATVLDAENHLVPDLTQDNFEVLDNDKPQPLIVFHSENLPITAVVMLDTSGSMTATIALLKEIGRASCRERV